MNSIIQEVQCSHIHQEELLKSHQPIMSYYHGNGLHQAKYNELKTSTHPLFIAIRRIYIGFYNGTESFVQCDLEELPNDLPDMVKWLLGWGESLELLEECVEEAMDQCVVYVHRSMSSSSSGGSASISC